MPARSALLARGRASRRAVGVVLVLLAAVVPARAQDPIPPGMAPVAGADRLDSLKSEIEALAAERARLAQEERGILGRIDSLAAEARLTDARIERLSLEQLAVAQQLLALNREAEAQERALVAARKRLRATAVLLQQAGPLMRMRLVSDAQDADRLAAGWRLAHELTARQRDAVAQIRTVQAAIESTRRARAARAAELEKLEAAAREERAALATSIRSRTTLLGEVRTQQATRRAAIAELERASRDLEQMLSAPPAGEGAAAWRPALDIRSFRGLLPMPSGGSVVQGFGDERDPRTGTVLPHRGWDLDAPFGAEVRAVFDGRVVWASWFRGYGLMVVVDHGFGVHSVYAHLSVVVASKGYEVRKGQVLGRVGDTGSLEGAKLYFEVRENGRAIDPSQWVKGRRRG